MLNGTLFSQRFLHGESLSETQWKALRNQCTITGTQLLGHPELTLVNLTLI
jgi:hypothetical protein